MFEVRIKLKGARGVVKLLARTHAAAERKAANANATPGCSATWTRLF